MGPDIAARVAAGTPLSSAELRDLLDTDILTLGMLADEVRRRLNLNVTYQRVHIVSCHDVGDGFGVPDAATEVRILGRPSTLGEAAAIVSRAKAAAGRRRVSGFSMADLVAASGSDWDHLPAVLASLAEAGLEDVAECPVDLLGDLEAVVSTARAAGFSAQRLTVARAIGDEKIGLLERVRRCKDTVGGIARFAPLPATVPDDKPTTGYEDVRMVALSRLALGHYTGAPVAIEVDWRLYGPKLAQVALTFGADHLDAVPATSDPSLGPRRGTVEDVERNIRAAGFEPQEYRP